jgi:hypothetical protein
VPELPARAQPPLRDALLLLPALPRAAAVVGRPDRWAAALAAWGVEVTVAEAELAVGSDPAALAATGAASVLLDGADRRGRLAAAGYRVRTWRTTPTVLGAVALVPESDPVLRRQLRTGGSSRNPRQLAADAVRRARGGDAVTVAVRAAASGDAGQGVEPRPLVLQQLQPAPGTVALLLGQASDRRRPVFLLGMPDGQHRSVIKTGFGAEAHRRAEAEQGVLRELARLRVTAVPVALGSGRVGELVWAAETALPGRPLLDVLGTMPPAAGLRALERAVDWLSLLAKTTRGPAAVDGGLQLRPPYDKASSLLPAGLPGVLVHGDLANNVLLDDGQLGVLDWETARRGLPLHDLLPLLCQGLARVRRVSPAEAPGLLLPTLRGETADSPWLMRQVRGSLRRLEIPLEAAGDLAAAALASWASLRLVHDELVRAAGGAVTAWTSPADVLAPRWLDDPHLGREWPALRAVG